MEALSGKTVHDVSYDFPASKRDIHYDRPKSSYHTKNEAKKQKTILKVLFFSSKNQRRQMYSFTGNIMIVFTPDSRSIKMA